MSVAARVDDWRADQKRSAKAFREIVWPEIVDYVGGGTLMSLEETGNDDLDRTGGIDAYQLLRTGIRTITQRTQFLDDYRKPATFTIRYSRTRNPLTEYQKRYDALNKGFETPGLVIQAYVYEKPQQFVRAGITHGRPFYEYVFASRRRWQMQATSNAEFLVVPWVAIAIDNGAEPSALLPFLWKNEMGVVTRTPDSWFSTRPNPFDQDLRYHSHAHRDRHKLWI